ncbi:MAG: hypothetical protein V3S08_01160 [Phycisphaerales bacterium]
MNHVRQTVLCGFLCLAFGGSAAAQISEVLRTLNSDDTVKGTDRSKSYPVLFDAYLELDPPPMEISSDFNIRTISPKMPRWAAVSDWVESNPGMADAILACQDRNILGLPYGEDAVKSPYREAGLFAAVGADGSLRSVTFPYLYAMDVIATYGTAEIYRLFEAGQTDRALALTVAYQWMLRQMCDRDFLEEKLMGITLLIEALGNVRSTFYLYQDDISADQFRALAWYDVPHLRPDRNRLLIPEGDRIVSEALLEEVFDSRTLQADPEQFARAFAEIQSANEPLTRFGAARRWRMIAEVHGSLEASKERLQLIYDDWWRRWRVQEYDAILETATQFERTNPVRYAAVIYSMQDIQDVFDIRNQLIASVNGTAVAAGLCAYKKTFGVFPDNKEKGYGQFIRKRISDIDPYDEDFGVLGYRLLTSDQSIDTVWGRLTLAKGQCVLYSISANHVDDRAREHSDAHIPVDGADFVFWPPIKTLAREQGKIN